MQILFFLLFFVVLALINVYSYKRFLRKLNMAKKYKKGFKYAVVLLFLLELSYIASFRADVLPQWAFHLLALSIGISFMLFVVSLAYEILHLALKLSVRSNFVASRRNFLKFILDLGVLFLFASYLFRGLFEGAKKPQIKHVKIGIKRLQKPLKIVHLTDLHIGNAVRKDFLLDLVKTVNSFKADLVVITGDLIDAKVASIKEDAKTLKDLASTYGTFFCFGNHEYMHNKNEIKNFLQTISINVLEDKAIEIDGLINLIGLSDLIAPRFNEPYNPQKGFANINAKLPSVVLSHQPKQIFDYESFKPDLALSGHTHGGQIFPFSILVALAQPYLAGLYQHSINTQIYVSKGTGFWGPPIRVFAPSEIAIVELYPQKHK